MLLLPADTWASRFVLGVVVFIWDVRSVPRPLLLFLRPEKAGRVSKNYLVSAVKDRFNRVVACEVYGVRFGATFSVHEEDARMLSCTPFDWCRRGSHTD